MPKKDPFAFDARRSGRLGGMRTMLAEAAPLGEPAGQTRGTPRRRSTARLIELLGDVGIWKAHDLEKAISCDRSTAYRIFQGKKPGPPYRAKILEVARKSRSPLSPDGFAELIKLLTR